MSAPSRSVVALVAVEVLAGCGQSKSPEHVVREWSAAINAGDNERAGALFAPGARVIAGDSIRVLETRGQAVTFNSALTFSGPIVKLSSAGDDVTATFKICARAADECHGKGSIDFVVRRGKIVLFNQIGR